MSLFNRRSVRQAKPRAFTSFTRWTSKAAVNCWMVLCCATLSVFGKSPAALDAQSTVHLASGGFLSGKIEGSEDPNTLRWQSPAFIEPFEFSLPAVSIVHFSQLPDPPKPTGDYCFELAGNDVLFGSLIGLTADELEIEAAPFGRLRVNRSKVTRLYRWRDSSNLIYLGPNGLAGWQEPNGKNLWREESGQLVADQPAAIFASLGIPAQACIEFEISWKSQPDFVLALGASDDPKSLQRAFRFEVWENELIVLREGSSQADLASVLELSRGAGRVQLQAYIDQQRGQITVFSITGEKIAELNIPDEQPNLLPGIWLANKQGDVRLERLRIVRWSGEPPVEVEADKARVHQLDGSILYGQVRELNAATQQFIIDKDGMEVRIDAAQLQGIYLPVMDDAEPAMLRVNYQDGTRLSGELLKVADGALWLSSAGIAEPLQAPIAGLYSLIVLQPSSPADDSSTDPLGKLQMPGVQLSGRLAPGAETAEQSCLVWHPLGSANASALRPGVSGRIIYREIPSTPPVNHITHEVPQARPRRGVVGEFFRVFSDSGSSGRVVSNSRMGGRRSLHLRTGDTIPCEITRIDEHGVTFTTNVTAATFVPHEKIKALELVHEQTSARIDRDKRDRLLTLPRIQKDNPPTHLIRSRSGDYLRGRLVEMDEETVKVEVRLETKMLPRDRISRIIWLHDDELESLPAVQQESVTRIQAIRRDGIRLTFLPQTFADSKLSGESDVLGPCQVELKDIDQLLMGSMIEEDAARLAFQQWKLQNAIEPKAFVSSGDDSQSGPAPGTQSNLVGQPAIDFELPMLDGGTFRLRDHRGKVVVLDFWATWCGPCIQAMPEVERVVGEFKDRDVQLVAVNLQESPEKIKAMLERHRLNVPVAIDQDGVVAEKYRVNAIPETIIIDGSGTIARCFIGGGSNFADNFREALEAVVSGSDTP